MEPGRLIRAAAFAAVLGLAACASEALNLPINAPIGDSRQQGNWTFGDPVHDETYVGLAFSGGGMRAAAYTYGALQELDAYRVQTRAGLQPLTESIELVGGVSGGSVTAAYFGLKGREGLPEFRRRFLERNAEEGFDTQVSIGNVVKVLSAGGLNDRSRFPRWLDDNLFEGATYADLFARRRPVVWVTASDLYNRVPFVFEPITFSAICSDLSTVRLSEAVAASAAVPGVFLPVNVENFGATCGSRVPMFMQRALADSGSAAMLRASAQALTRLRDDPAAHRYVKLLDGGITDNFGVHPLAIMRTNRDRGHVPLTAEQGARLKRFLFLVIDSGRGPAGDWSRELKAPGVGDLVNALTDAAIVGATYRGYDYLRAVMRDWEEEMKQWRCSLSPAEVRRLRGSLQGWNCRDVTFSIGRVTFEDAGPQVKPLLDAVPTRFVLEPAIREMVIDAGAAAVRNNPTFREFVRRSGIKRVGEAGL
ncbi:patatin-like phospholipase family protein [Salinarimonas soli]|nr:patatin-like phospholipase family protein [Salinarimonas soli]